MINLKQILYNGETGSIEFKRSANRDIAKEVAAFASSRGGMIIIGVSDEQRTIIGIQEKFETVQQKIQNWIHAFVRPEPQYSIQRASYGGSELVVIKIESGSKPAYSFKDRFYYRNHEQSQRMPASEIERRFNDDKIAKAIVNLKSEISAANPQDNIAAGIYGQSELATLTYDQLLEMLIRDLKPHLSGG